MRMTYELQSATWLPDGSLMVAYRSKSMFAGASALKNEQMTRARFVSFFGKQALPPKP